MPYWDLAVVFAAGSDGLVFGSDIQFDQARSFFQLKCSSSYLNK